MIKLFNPIKNKDIWELQILPSLTISKTPSNITKKYHYRLGFKWLFVSVSWKWKAGVYTVND